MKSLLIIVFSLVWTYSFTQELQYLWAERIGDDALSSDGSRSIAYDAEGNVYSAGYFSGTVDFDPGEDEYLITSVFGRDAYLQKLDADGALVWVKIIGDEQSQQIMDMDVDLSGNITVMGEFRNIVDFDPGPEESLMSPNGATDVFIVTFDAAGDYLWSKKMGCKSHDYAGGISFDYEGNVLATTSYRDTILFTTPDDTIEFIPVDWFDMAIAKFNPYGDLIWAKTIGGTGQKGVRDLAVDFEGNVLVTGVFQGTVDVDPSLEEHTMTSLGYHDFFMVKLSPDGDYIWANHIGGMFEQISYRCTGDGYGNIYLVGTFQSNVDFDPGPEEEVLVSNGYTDCFIQKFDSGGELVWVKQIGGSYGDVVNGVDVDAYKNVYITGSFTAEVDFDPGDEEFIIDANGQGNVFIQKMDQFGNFIWAKDIDGTYGCKGLDIGADDFENVYVTGAFYGEADFNPGPAEALLETTGGADGDVFVAKFSQCASSSHQTAMACVSYTWDLNDSTYTTEGVHSYLLTNTMGCDSIVNLHLMLDTLNTDLIVEDFTITIAFDIGAEYQWIDCDNDFEAIPGETGASFTASHSGHYAVIVNDGTCIDTSDCVELIVTIGLNETNPDSVFEVYPNPFDELTTIYISELIHTPVTISIFDTFGREVYRQIEISESQLQIERGGLDTGIYIIVCSESLSGKVLSKDKLVVY